MTGGVVLDDKDAVTTKTVPNVVVCNKKPTADDYTATLFTDKSTPAVAVKAKFTGANFTPFRCFSTRCISCRCSLPRHHDVRNLKEMTKAKLEKHILSLIYTHTIHDQIVHQILKFECYAK